MAAVAGELTGCGSAGSSGTIRQPPERSRPCRPCASRAPAARRWAATEGCWRRCPKVAAARRGAGGRGRPAWTLARRAFRQSLRGSHSCCEFDAPSLLAIRCGHLQGVSHSGTMWTCCLKRIRIETELTQNEASIDGFLYLNFPILLANFSLTENSHATKRMKICDFVGCKTEMQMQANVLSKLHYHQLSILCS